MQILKKSFLYFTSLLFYTKNYENTYLSLFQRKADTKETLNFCPKSRVKPFGKMEIFRLREVKSKLNSLVFHIQHHITQIFRLRENDIFIV